MSTVQLLSVTPLEDGIMGENVTVSSEDNREQRSEENNQTRRKDSVKRGKQIRPCAQLDTSARCVAAFVRVALSCVVCDDDDDTCVQLQWHRDHQDDICDPAGQLLQNLGGHF